MINNDKMKIQKKNLFLLLIAMVVFTLLCCNSRVSSVNDVVSDDSKTDDYDILKNPDKIPQKVTEDLSGKVIVLNEEDFIERITVLDNPKGFQYKGQTPCIVDLYASWCRPCGYLSQVMSELVQEYQGKVIFYKLDIDRARKVVYAFDVKSIPMILYFKPHGGVSTTVGYLNHEELRKAIDEYLLNP